MANLEFFQFHPTAMLGDDKNRLMSEAARGEGGRVWVPRQPGDQRDPLDIPEAQRYYFLEDWYPAYGNTVPRDVACRAIWKVVRDSGMGIGGEDKVYLDLTHLDPNFIRTRLGAILDIYTKFQGVDPTQRPMEIFPTAHYAMGGLWVDYEKDPERGGMRYGSPRNHATSIPGLFACGECDYAYHGANRLGANSLLSTSFSGRVAGVAVASWVKGLETSAEGAPAELFEEECQRQEAINRGFLTSSGKENIYTLHRELGELMTTKVGLVRDNRILDEAIGELQELEQRCARLDLGERAGWSNQTLVYARQVHEMIVLGQAMARSARQRDECRGAHHKPAFELAIPEGKYPGDPEFEEYRATWKANNERWIKTSVATWSPDGASIDYEPVDSSVLPPEQPRDYR